MSVNIWKQNYGPSISKLLIGSERNLSLKIEVELLFLIKQSERLFRTLI